MRTHAKIALQVLAVLAIFAAPLPAASQTTLVTYRCNKPTSGARPVLFRWYTAIATSPTDTLGTKTMVATSADSTCAIPLPARDAARVWVTGVDAAGREGPLSPASERRDPPPPAACGKPRTP
jgi:hypothetical protein